MLAPVSWTVSMGAKKKVADLDRRRFCKDRNNIVNISTDQKSQPGISIDFYIVLDGIWSAVEMCIFWNT